MLCKKKKLNCDEQGWIKTQTYFVRMHPGVFRMQVKKISRLY